MVNIEQLNSLPDKIKALICIAILIDGKEASDFIGDDPKLVNYIDLINQINLIKPEIKVPIIGTILRDAISKGTK